MATVDGIGHWRGSGNPFPPAAVARISDLRPEVLTIKTAAVREIDRLIDSYLRDTRVAEASGPDRSGDQMEGAGKVFVIEGDYGTGKTHLAIEILDRVEGSHIQQMDTRVFYHVAPGGTFLTLYTDLMSRVIGSSEVLERVREFYADIVADALRERPFTQTLVGQLERGDADPQLVIDRYGLSEGALREELRQRLSSVTSDEAFSRALMLLLLQPELRDLTWDWFVGGVPSQVLVERAIPEPIQTDVQAMEALGVIARLYGRKNRRFVLVIDEMERLALAWDRSDSAKAQAFKKLLEVFHGAGALLVVCGLSDIFAVLPRDPDRIDAVIHPSLLTDDDVRWYIEATQERAFSRRVLEPFTEESIKYLVYLTGGIARDVLRFCYYAYEYASETGYEITSSVVNSVARNRSPSGGVEMVRSEIGDLLFVQGWKADRRRALGDPPDVTADFWVPVGERGTGCAIIISDSILEEPQARRLGKQLTAIKSATAGPAVILVVSGYLPSKLRQPLLDALGGDPLIVFSARTFDQDFTVALNTAIDRIGPAPNVPNVPGDNATAYSGFRILRAEIERVARQQASALRFMQELADRTGERLNAVQQALEATSGPASEARETRSADLSAELEEMFSVAHRSLATYGDVRKFIAEAFEIAAQEPGARFSLKHRLREPDAFSPIGVATFLSDLLMSFRESIRTWIGTLSPGGESPTASERERLRGICRTYDVLYDVTPVFKLDPLPEITSMAGGEQEVFFRAGRSARRETLTDAFVGLGDRVYQAAIDLASGAGRRPGRTDA